MMELTTGVVAGTAGASLAETLHADPSYRPAEDYLMEICEILTQMHKTLRKEPAVQKDQHETLQLYNNQNQTIRFKDFLYCFILIPAACVLTVTVSGLPPFTITFAAAPTAGQFPIGVYTRWRYPEGSILLLTTPTQTSYFPIEILYTNDPES